MNECGKIKIVGKKKMDTRDYSGSPTGTPLPPHLVKEFTMLESLLQAISPQDPPNNLSNIHKIAPHYLYKKNLHQNL